MESNHPNSPTATLLPCGAVQCSACESIIYEDDEAVERGEEYLCARCANEEVEA
jgi:formylmethanofuran dehydrogenase subunit E